MSVPPLHERRQKNLVLILAREFASKLATATFLVDGEGTLVFYNEAAEGILGRSFSEAGEIEAANWGSVFEVEHLDGSPMRLEEMPGGIALLERRPVHRESRIPCFAGERTEIAVTALHRFAHADELVGIFCIFWEG